MKRKYHPNMLPLIQHWAEQQPSEKFELLAPQVYLIRDREIALSVLNEDGIFEIKEQSGFYKSRNFNPFPENCQDSITALLKNSLKQFKKPTVSELSNFFRSKKRSSTQRWGVESARYYFRDLMVSRDKPKYIQLAVNKIVDQYVENAVILDAVRRQVPIKTAGLNVRRYANELIPYIEIISESRVVSNKIDLIDVAVEATLPDTATAEDRADLYLRLVLSVTAFTGVSLEWLFMEQPLNIQEETFKGTTEQFISLLSKSLRQNPTAWRVTRSTENSIFIDGKNLAAGTEFVIPTCPHAYGSQQDLFPDWGLSFGSGPSACPGRGAAINGIVAMAQGAYDAGITVTKRPLSRSLVASISSPPMSRVTFGSDA